MINLLLPFLGPVIDKLVGLIPDPQARAKAQAEAMASILEAGQKADAAQMEINKVEASSSSIFVAGWRPFIGWVCGAGFAWNWIGLPVAVFITNAAGNPLALSPADLSEMMPLLLGMLGMGGLRTFEKMQGVAREKVK